MLLYCVYGAVHLHKIENVVIQFLYYSIRKEAMDNEKKPWTIRGLYLTSVVIFLNM